jgi:hypothetical protein
MSDKLQWEELEPLASGWDCVWNDKEKLEWAKQAWGFIGNAGLASYSSSVERGKVVIRFLALAGIFSDFYEIAFSDGHKPEYSYIADALGLTPFHLGQLVGSNTDWEHDNDEDELEWLQHLSTAARPEVYSALVLGFGHLPSLFISLWKTNASPADYGDDDEDDNSIANRNLTPEKFQAYEWLTEGCYPWD